MRTTQASEEPAVVAIVPAAGAGTRLGAKTAKAFVALDGIPLVVHTLRALEAAEAIDAIILVLAPAYIERAKKLVARYRLKKVTALVGGGATRTESVKNGLALVSAATDVVLVHDAARPFVDGEAIAACIRDARRYGAAVCAAPCVATIKSATPDLYVKATLDRAELWQIQTPQGFSYRVLADAYAYGACAGRSFYDDASLVETMGHTVKIVPSSTLNMKITTPDDVKLAQAIVRLKTKRGMRSRCV